MKNNDPIEQMEYSFQQMNLAFENLKAQKLNESRIWQKRSQDLQTQVDSLRNQLQEALSSNDKMRNELNEAISECEAVKSQNSMLSRTLMEKEREISNFLALNQSLKQLLEQPTNRTYTSPSIQKEEIRVNAPSLNEVSPPTKQSKLHSVSNTSQQSAQSTTAPSLSKSSQFIRTAKEELTYSDFNQMISEINKFNRRTQTREETFANVKAILLPSHKALHDQFISVLSGF